MNKSFAPFAFTISKSWMALLAAVLLCGTDNAAAAADRDAFGGWTGLTLRRTGFFHVQETNGVWWLVTPEGHAFLSKGVNHISYTADYAPKLGYAPYGRATSAKYGSAEKWAEATVARLKDWGFNTVGAWSTPILANQKIPFTVLIGAAEAGGANWQRGEAADVFAPGFAEAVRERARRICARHADDPYLLGYFTDNELRWAADWRSKKSLFESFLQKTEDTPARSKAIALVRATFRDLEQLNAELHLGLASFDELFTASLPETEALRRLNSAFLRDYADAYFKACAEAVKAADPNHLNLGCRFAGYAPKEVVEAMGPHVDLVSFNNYAELPPEKQLQQLHDLTGRPLIIGEFSFKALDSGLPNTRGAGKPLSTQQDRADRFDQYITALLRLPFMVGYHWFEYADEPAEGRFDGENSNYGLVNIQDEPWEVLTRRMTHINQSAESQHRDTMTIDTTYSPH